MGSSTGQKDGSFLDFFRLYNYFYLILHLLLLALIWYQETVFKVCWLSLIKRYVKINSSFFYVWLNDWILLRLIGETYEFVRLIGETLRVCWSKSYAAIHIFLILSLFTICGVHLIFVCEIFKSFQNLHMWDLNWSLLISRFCEILLIISDHWTLHLMQLLSSFSTPS